MAQRIKGDPERLTSINRNNTPLCAGRQQEKDYEGEGLRFRR
jgi:hypothetical protein